MADEQKRQRGADLSRMTKAQLISRYRQLGGLGGIHPPEKWRKDELVTSILEMEGH